MKNFNFKKLVFALCFLTFSFGSAQVFEITPSYGYQFGSKMHYYGGYLRFEDGDQYAINLGVETGYNIMADISYTRHFGGLYDYNQLDWKPGEEFKTDIAVDNFQVGGSKYFVDESELVRPFLGGGLGFSVITPQNGYSSKTKFSFSFKGGVNLMFSEVIGLNLQGNLYFPVQWGGVYISGGSGGANGGVSLSTTTIVGGFSSGLVFKIDANK